MLTIRPLIYGFNKIWVDFLNVDFMIGSFLCFEKTVKTKALIKFSIFHKIEDSNRKCSRIKST